MKVPTNVSLGVRTRDGGAGAGGVTGAAGVTSTADARGGAASSGVADARGGAASSGVTAPSTAAPRPSTVPLAVPFAPTARALGATAAADHGGRPLAATAALVHAAAGKPPIIALTSAQPLAFEVPFGDGDDRHTGVRAASALVKLGDTFVIAQDDSNFAAVWRGGSVTALRVFAREGADTFSKERGNKALKPDLEVGTAMRVGGAESAVLFGSGSTPARMRAAAVTPGPSGFDVRTADLSSLYAAAQARLGVGADVLNLEAAAAVGERVLFFQRGNGAGAVNASFAVPRHLVESALLEGRPIAASELFDVRRHALGTLDGCALGFSDAAPLPDGRVLVLAAAEASPNTYDDGAIAGSVLMVLDQTGALSPPIRVPDGPHGPYKLEGLAVSRVEGGVAHLVAVEDADDPSKPSTALTLELVLP